MDPGHLHAHLQTMTAASDQKEVGRELDRLARRAAKGDREAAATLLPLLGPSMLASVRAVLGAGNSDVEDVLQGSFVRTLESLQQYEERGSLHGFACRIATRTAVDHLRKRFGRGNRPVEFLPLNEAWAEDKPSGREDDPLDRISVGLFLEDLSAEQSETVILRMVLGYSIEDVARLMNTPVNTIRSRLRRARTSLRERLGIEGSGSDEDGT